MSALKVQPQRKLWIGAAGLILLLSILGCSLGSILPDENAPDANPLPTNTDTPTPIPSDTPTIAPSPTDIGIPSATVKPTLRPSWTPFPSKTIRPTWTASPTLSPTATAPVGVLLEQDFNDPDDMLWMQKKGGNWATGLAGKKYFMSVYAPKVEITSARTWLKLDEVRIEADIWHSTGKGYYGFNCRESPGGNYYTIFITTDGYYGFGENRNEKLTVLKSAPLPKWEPPIDPKGPNRVRADCRGNALTLFINGEAVDRVTIPGLGVGYVGMMIGTRLEDDRLTMYYDDLVIYGPLKEE